MKRAVLTALLLILTSSAPARAGYLDGYIDVSLSADHTEFRAPYEAVYYYGPNDIDWNADVTGTAHVEQTNPATNFDSPFSKKGQQRDILEGPTTSGACYYASLQATGDPWGPFNSEEKTWNAGPACNTQPFNSPPPPPPPPEDIQECTPYCSPLVLDLGGDGIATSGADDPVRFDIDADGVVDTIGWLARNGDDAFLWRDVEQNHRVDDGSELFGVGMTLPDGHRAADGFQALAAYDRIENGGNADGLITNRDAVWGRLRLWVDADHDGVSDATELSPVQSSHVLSLSLARIESSDVDAAGNQLRLRGRYRYRLVGGLSEHRALVDVFFRRL